MTVMNDLDRFHLVMNAIDRVPRTGDKGIYLKPGPIIYVMCRALWDHNLKLELRQLFYSSEIKGRKFPTCQSNHATGKVAPRTGATTT